MTSQAASLRAGEFLLKDWAKAGLHVPTAVKQGLYTVHESLIVKRLGQLSPSDQQQLEQSLRLWLGL
jgi:mRNA interferase MazF